MLPGWSPTTTSPSPAAGAANTGPTVAPCHSGAHTFGVPEQLTLPSPSNAYTPPALALTKTSPCDDVGVDVNVTPGTRPLHNGVHVLSAPEQFVAPVASNAWRSPSAPVAY